MHGFLSLEFSILVVNGCSIPEKSVIEVYRENITPPDKGLLFGCYRSPESSYSYVITPGRNRLPLGVSSVDVQCRA
jgi:hypothetical protein